MYTDSYCTKLWTAIYDSCNKDEFRMYVYGTTAVSMAVFWIPSMLLMFVDYTGHPSLLLRYKVQPGKNQPISTERMLRCMWVALRNQVVIGVPFTALVYLLFRDVRGVNLHPLDLPPWQKTLLDLVVCLAFEEIGFYYTHRLFHLPTFYKRYHKQHHEWTAPVGAVALYAHPLEHVVANLTPPVLGPLVMGSHLSTMWLWFTIAILSTVTTHSGYHFPLLLSPEYHDFHHFKFNANYGSLGILDRLHGTDAMFRQSRASHRHTVLLSFTPVYVTIPD